MAPYSSIIPFAFTFGTPLLGAGFQPQPQPKPEAENRPRPYKCNFCDEVFESRYALSSHYGKHKDLPQSEWIKNGPAGSKIRKDIIKAREEGKTYVFKRGPWTRNRTRQAPQARPQARKRVPSPKPIPARQPRATNFPQHPLHGLNINNTNNLGGLLMSDTVNVVDAPPGFPVRDTSRVIPFRRLRGFRLVGNFYGVATPIFEAMIPIQGSHGICTGNALNPHFHNVGQAGSSERPRGHALHKGNEVGSSSNVAPTDPFQNVTNPVIKKEVGAPVGEEVMAWNVKVKKEF